LFLAVLSTVADGLVKVAAKQNGQNPDKFGVLPNDVPSLLGMGSSKPNYVPKNEHFLSLKQGFNIRLIGEAKEVLDTPIETVHTPTYAIKPKDFVGMSPIPKVIVQEGDNLKAGDILFYDKKRPEIKYAAPVSGEMLRIQRGEKRSINEVIVLADKEIEYRQYDLPNLETASYEELSAFLLESGAWPFIRQRPFDIVADHTARPKSIFVTTFDTAPLAPGFDLTVRGREAEFQKGLDVLSKLTEGAVHVALNANEEPPVGFSNITGVEKHWVKGAHPAGNVGIHIHHIDPINAGDIVWHLDVHGVLVLGTLFEKGIFDTRRITAFTGAELENPHFVYAHQGICIENFVGGLELTTTVTNANGEKASRANIRLVSGDPLTGKQIDSKGYLGFFDDQLTTIAEGDYYELFGWLIPQKGHPTIKKSFPGGLVKDVYYKADTQQNGEHRAWVVSGEYEAVLPMDVYPQHLMRAIKSNDFEKMEGLGILELGEEDIALCEYVCTSKQPLQHMLREGLDMIREQG
jgi:Na+-transporting NADH:ubiquinone oxidoreductase subunit A